jgi:hypothetical protein
MSQPFEKNYAKSAYSDDASTIVEHSCTTPQEMLWYCRAMNHQAEAASLKQNTLELYNLRVGIALSLILSLTMIAILSKHLVNYWLFVPALTVPISLAVYFRNRMVLLGPFVYAAVLIGILSTAIFFGM